MGKDILQNEIFYSGIRSLQLTGDGVVPRRLSEGYLKFSDRAYSFRVFARTCASVKLRFNTDAKIIRLCYQSQALSDGDSFSDLYVDDEYAGKTRYGGVVCPPGFFGVPGGESEGFGNLLEVVNVPLQNILNGGNECEIFQAILFVNNFFRT